MLAHPRSIHEILDHAQQASISRPTLSKASGVSLSTMWRTRHELNAPNIGTLRRLEKSITDILAARSTEKGE